MSGQDLSRRRLLQSSLGLALLRESGSSTVGRQADSGSVQVCIFSKHLQWLSWEEMGRAAAELGFDGVDLTVRPGGHVEPEKVEDDLPRAVEAVAKSGLSVPMITTGIADPASPFAEQILGTATRSGIRRYRWGGLEFNQEKSIPEQLADLKPRVADLAAMNRQYGLCAMYHTHSGAGEVGASFWDLWLLLKEHDPRWVSANFDIGHATVEGGLGGWIHSTRLLAPYIRGVAVKDFLWARTDRGPWRPHWCPLGEGMVDFPEFFGMLRESGFSGPIQVHYEYPLGGADKGRRDLTIPKAEILAAMRKDLETLRKWL